MSDPDNQAPATAKAVANGGRAVAAAQGGVAAGGDIHGGVHIHNVATPPPLIAPPKLAPTRLTHVAEHLFGREADLAKLDAAWADPKIHVATFVAWGGVGKTSLVAKWAAEKDLGGADYFDWSFYSQGTREEGSASGEPFIAAALRFFGEEEGEGEKIASSAMSGWDKGAKLAAFVTRRKALLILDGLEPLQYPPSSPKEIAGQLKDPGIRSLLRGLAAQNPGLCVVTTRESVKDLAAFRGGPAPEWSLERLSTAAGVALLEKLQVKGRQAELEGLVEEVDGHALTLQLLGSFLHDAHEGDIRKRDLVGFEEADREMQGGHAFRTIAAYERWLVPKRTLSEKASAWFSGKREDSVGGKRQLGILRLLGLFDRPAPADCLNALRRAPRISDLTEALVGISDTQWNLAISRLAAHGLVSVAGTTLDSHPLVREYFGRHLRENSPRAWRAGHLRLFKHLQDTTPFRPDTLEGLQPLYQAVAHGCHAGRHEGALANYDIRIQRGEQFYSTRRLGAIGANLGALTCFFDPPWSRVSTALTVASQGWVLNEAGNSLRALGRLSEASDPMRSGMELSASYGEWLNAAIGAGSLSDLELTLGDISASIREAEMSVSFADRSSDTFFKLASRAGQASKLHQAGNQGEALTLFSIAERMQAEWRPAFPRLYSLQGFLHCDLLLSDAERAAGRGHGVAIDLERHLKVIREVEGRGAAALAVVLDGSNNLFDISLNHLVLGRAMLFKALLEGADPEPARAGIEQAVDGFRRAVRQDHLPKALLTRAWLLFLEGNPAAARADLAEAQEIAERGPMPLFLADIALYRGRLFGDRAALAEARRLIEKHGYGRRLEELADAEEASGMAD